MRTITRLILLRCGNHPRESGVKQTYVSTPLPLKTTTRVRAMFMTVGTSNYSTADAYFIESDAIEMQEPSSGAGSERGFAVDPLGAGACSVSGYERPP